MSKIKFSKSKRERTILFLEYWISKLAVKYKLQRNIKIVQLFQPKRDFFCSIVKLWHLDSSFTKDMVMSFAYNNQQMNNPYNGHNLPNNALPFFNNFSSYLPPFDLNLNHPPPIQPRVRDPYDQKQMKQIVDQIRFKQKMQAINKKKGKYKRSTNNCHKKYIGIVKNLMILKIENEVKTELLANFHQYRNSRVYYFIILSYVKWYLPVTDIRWIYQHFCKQIEAKMTRYKLEISTTNNCNFVHFREDQIIEMDYAIQAINCFLLDEEEQAIRLLYQKNKYIIIKKNEYLKALELIKKLRNDLKNQFQTLNLELKLKELKLDEVYQWKKEDTDKYIDQANLQNQREKCVDSQDGQIKQKKMFKKNLEEEGQEGSSFPHVMQENCNGAQYFPMENIVKCEESSYFDYVGKYPLIGLECSYPTIDFVTWHTWQLHKQKQFEFQMKMRQLGNFSYDSNFCYKPPRDD